MFSLDNKTAIVTGGSSGIGLAIVQAFLKQGANVHILDLAGKPKDLEFEDDRLSFHNVDISDSQAVNQLVQDLDRQNSIDIIVNNAGIAQIGNIENTSIEDFNRLFQINVVGAFNCIKALIPAMKTRKNGCILNIASIAGTLGLADRFAYSMTKGAVLSMTLSIAKDYINHGIRCNSISPARVHTPFVDGFIAKNYPGKESEMFAKLSASQPIGRMAKPEEIAGLAVYLCSSEAAFITGCDYLIDGGFTKLNT